MKFNKSVFLLIFIAASNLLPIQAQNLKMPANGVNYKCLAGRSLGVTDIEVKWNAPGVKGREGKIWGTDIAYFGTTILGFGSNVASPWRAGADESTNISFSTDVLVNGKLLSAGKYGFFMELGQDSCTLIFNKNTQGWGSYFYDRRQDVLRVKTAPIKNMPQSKERLEYTFSNQMDNSIEVALEWEYWRIPMKVEVDLNKTSLASIRSQLSSALGFDAPSLVAGAKWCLDNEVNYDEALNWINTATNSNFGGINTFNSLSVKAGLLEKLNQKEEAANTMSSAYEVATAIELHQYGRQLLNQKKINEAKEVFEKNYKKNSGAWPTNVGMMRVYSALGDYKKALDYARLALVQAPDEVNKKNLERSISTLESGKAL